MYEFTISKCAEMLERDRATLVRVLREVPPDDADRPQPLYRLGTVVKALIAYEAKPDGRQRGKAGDLDLSKERAALARQQTEAVAHKNALARGESVAVADVVRSASIIIAAFRERILSIPGKTAASCAMRPADEIEGIVRDELHEALDELSRPILSAVGDTGDSGEAVDDGPVGLEAATDPEPD